MPDILDLIDHAVADHGVSGDAMRCTPAPPPRSLEDIVAEALSALESALRLAFEETATAFRQLPATGIAAPGPPADPRERALAARRNRNTGPRPAVRAPRRIDPTRGR